MWYEESNFEMCLSTTQQIYFQKVVMTELWSRMEKVPPNWDFGACMREATRIFTLSSTPYHRRVNFFASKRNHGESDLDMLLRVHKLGRLAEGDKLSLDKQTHHHVMCMLSDPTREKVVQMCKGAPNYKGLKEALETLQTTEGYTGRKVNSVNHEAVVPAGEAMAEAEQTEVIPPEELALTTGWTLQKSDVSTAGPTTSFWTAQKFGTRSNVTVVARRAM